MPSGEIRLVKENLPSHNWFCRKSSHQKATIGKAGRNRWKGRRPRVRGVAMNPVDHPWVVVKAVHLVGVTRLHHGDNYPKDFLREKNRNNPTR